MLKLLEIILKKKKKKGDMLGESSQDGIEKGPQAHLLSWTHQNHSNLQNNHCWKSLKPTMKDLQLTAWRRKYNKMVGGVYLQYNQISHPPEWAAHKLKNNYITESLPQEWELWTQCQHPHPSHQALETWAPRIFGFEGQPSSITGAPRDWGK